MVHAETEGNPLFVGEIVRLLAAERRLDEPATAPLAIPQSVREVIGRRLRHLSDECNRLLTLASVLGREFDLDALAAVSGLERGAILELLDEAIEARVVSEVPGAIGRMRFAHALIRDAAYHRLTTSRRVQLHRQVGEALEALYSSDLDPHLAELAHHFFESAAGGDGQKAVDYARRAGARAGRPARLRGGGPPVPDGARGTRLEGRPPTSRLAASSCSRWVRPRPAAARWRLRRKPSRAPPPRQGSSACRSCLPVRRSATAVDSSGCAPEKTGGSFHCSRTRSPRCPKRTACCGSSCSPGSPGRSATSLRQGPSPRSAGKRSRWPGGCDDPATLAYALDSVYAGITYPQQVAEWRATADELVQAAEAADDKERAFAGHQHRLGVLMLEGDLEGVDAELQAMERLVDELRQPAQTWALTLTQTARALFAGQFPDAEALIERTRELGRRAQTPDVTFFGSQVLQQFVLRREQGRLEEVEAGPRALRRRVPRTGRVPLRAGGPAHARPGARPTPATSLKHWQPMTSRSLPSRQEWFFGAGLLAEVCAVLGDRRRAATLYELLLPYAGCNQLNYVEVCCGSTSRYLGLLATTMSRWQDAEYHFQAAIEMDQRTGGWPWLAHSKADYGRMLLARGTPHDREQARGLLHSARATYDQLGMATHAARASALSERGSRATAGR